MSLVCNRKERLLISLPHPGKTLLSSLSAYHNSKESRLESGSPHAVLMTSLIGDKQNWLIVQNVIARKG